MDCLRTGKSARTFSTSKPAEISVPIMLMKFLEEYLFQLVAQRRDLDAVDDVLREGVGQQAARLFLADATGLQVEERFGIQLADSCAVGAAHVVGMNLQFRLGVDHGVDRKSTRLNSSHA